MGKERLGSISTLVTALIEELAPEVRAQIALNFIANRAGRGAVQRGLAGLSKAGSVTVRQSDHQKHNHAYFYGCPLPVVPRRHGPVCTA